MTRTIALLPGDGTGPEICDAILPLFAKAGADLSFERLDIGACANDVCVEQIKRRGVALMAHHRGQRDGKALPPIVDLRQKLGVYANLRPFRSLRGVPAVFDDVDVLVVRETTEDIYAHLEHESMPGVFEGLKVTTQAACERIARTAFETARRLGRKKVTIVHKSNIMKLSDGLFLRTAKAVGEQFPDIITDEVIVDALCMKLVLDPRKFDVLVAGNLFGDLVADLCAGLVGGTVNDPSINLGPNVAVFTTGHGDDPSLVGTGNANPLPLLLASLHLLEHVGEGGARKRLGAALEAAVNGGAKPVGLGGPASCAQFVAAVAERL